MQHFINKCVKSGFRITFLFDKEEGRFILLKYLIKIKRPHQIKIEIMTYLKKRLLFKNELYNNEKEYLK